MSELMPGEISRDLLDDERTYPAARCRGCGVLTYVCSVVEGVKATKTRHHKGCSKPPGRLALRLALGRYDPRLEAELFGERLRSYMTDEEVVEAASRVPDLLEEIGEDGSKSE